MDLTLQDMLTVLTKSESKAFTLNSDSIASCVVFPARTKSVRFSNIMTVDDFLSNEDML